MQPGTNQHFAGGSAQPTAASSEETKKAKKQRVKKDKRQRNTGRVAGKRNALIAAALAVVVLVAVLTTGSSEPKTTWVLRARVSINSLEQVQEGMLEAIQLPPEAVEPQAISGDSSEAVLAAATGTDSDAAVVGSFPTFPIRQGQQVSFEMFADDGRTNLNLQAEERLVSISASATSSVAGVLRAGDRVDVVAVNGPERSAGVVASDIEIVSVQVAGNQLNNAASRQASEAGRELSPEDLLPRDPIPGVYVVRTDVQTAAALAIADTTSPLYLLYRAPNALTTPVGEVLLSTVIDGSGEQVPVSGEISGEVSDDTDVDVDGNADDSIEVITVVEDAETPSQDN
jgi:Flp pilus assembly protein CpaB